RRESGEQGSDLEDEHSRQKYAPSPQLVAERPADEDQRAKKESVWLDNPLNVGDGRAEIALERGERDVHDGAVDEGHARRDDRGDQRPPFARARRALSYRGARSHGPTEKTSIRPGQLADSGRYRGCHVQGTAAS